MSEYENLVTTLFKDYQKELRPLVDGITPTKVTVILYLSSIQELDEISQQLTISAYLQVRWIDNKLTWTPANHGGIVYFVYTQNKIWLPDLTITNSVENMEELGYSRSPVYILHDGSIVWTPSGIFKTSCEIDVTYYPFDTQQCDIIISTVMNGLREIDLENHNAMPVSLDFYSTSASWALERLDSETTFDTSAKTRIAFTLRLRRLRTYYVVTVIVPVIFLSLTATLLFALPADSGEKMGTSITVLLAFAVYLTILSEQMPRTSLQVSVLAVYLTLLLGQTALGVVLTVWILNLHFRYDDEHPPGRRMRKIVYILQLLMCWRKRGKLSNVEPAITPKESLGPRPPVEPNKHTNDDVKRFAKSFDVKRQLSMDSGSSFDIPDLAWRMTSYTFDRFFFYFFSAFLLLVTVVCMAFLLTGGGQ